MAKIGKVALVASSEVSNWTSCRTITGNLIKAYFGFLKPEQVSFFSLPNKYEKVWDVARKIYEARPERIIFVDHAPHPQKILLALDELYGNGDLPKIYFHVYGDFTLYPVEWIEVEKILEKTQVQFICASDRQNLMVSRFVSKPQEGGVKTCHFPSDVTVFKADSKARNEWRKKLGLKPGELAILYTGRISLQKNVLRLLHEIHTFYETSKIPLRLFLAGSFDDIGAPFFNLRFPTEYYFPYWTKQIETFPEDFRKRVEYLGNLGASSLAGLCNAADVFTSLSLYHDEDYGMSPAEALCCGTPAVLTDWGGYASFYDGTPGCRLTPVSIGRFGLEISSQDFQKSLLIQSSQDQSDEARQDRSKHFQSKLSIEAASEKLVKIHSQAPPAFKGFGWRLRKYSESFSISEGTPFPEGPQADTFYEEIYGSYIAQ